MISQADILKTLINKSCTDDAVMATALSQDCTPPKLLEKLTEAERFDVALDISMKLGLDVIPLWRTWALRALRHRNFSTARDKFRHCFQRFRLPGRSNSSQQSQLLASILIELCRMQESEPPLLEEIELIRRRKLLAESQECTQQQQQQLTAPKTPQTVIEKPKIFNECLYYLESYGTAKDFVRFYVRNFLWYQAAEYLIKNNKQAQFSQMRLFFVEEVFLYSSVNGQLNRLLEAFIELDPHFIDSAPYLEAMCEHCHQNQKFHLLYYLQYFSGNHLAAAHTQIYHIFLRKPVHSYHELNARLSSLLEARKNCQDFLDSSANNKCPPANQTLPTVSFTTSLTHTPQQSTTKPWLESEAAVERLIKTINQQIEITRNFASNEVSGCINGIEFSIKSDSSSSSFRETKPDNEANSEAANAESNNDIPVTLFDTSKRRKTFFAALVLTYFDLSCTTYFSKNGLDLAKQLIDDYQLDELALFKLAMQILMRDESCDIFKNANLLLDRIREYYAISGPAASDEPASAKAKPTLPKPRLGQDGLPQAPSAQKLLGQPMANLRLAATPSRLPKMKLGASTGSNSASKDRVSTKRRQPMMSESGIREVCDEVILDSIKSCTEYDYKMELAKLLSSEAQIEFYIGSGKLSNAQRLACNLNRPDYVSRIIKEAARLNQEHVKTVCQLWLAKHETRNLLR